MVGPEFDSKILLLEAKSKPIRPPKEEENESQKKKRKNKNN